MKDPYATEEETKAILVPDTRTPAESKLDELIEAHYGNEQGAELELALRQVALQLIEQAEKQKGVARYCCHSCFKVSDGVMLARMIVCPDCGNKRCPKASNHTFQCTNSNELNQTGSIYTSPQPQAEQEPAACLHRLVDVTNPVVKSGYMCMDCGAVFRAAYESQPKAEQEVRLWDSQWTNVVNHDNCYEDWSKEDAINHAVKMTEQLIASNVAANKLPPAQSKEQS